MMKRERSVPALGDPETSLLFVRRMRMWMSWDGFGKCLLAGREGGKKS